MERRAEEIVEEHVVEAIFNRMWFLSWYVPCFVSFEDLFLSDKTGDSLAETGSIPYSPGCYLLIFNVQKRLFTLQVKIKEYFSPVSSQRLELKLSSEWWFDGARRVLTSLQSFILSMCWSALLKPNHWPLYFTFVQDSFHRLIRPEERQQITEFRALPSTWKHAFMKYQQHFSATAEWEGNAFWAAPIKASAFICW